MNKQFILSDEQVNSYGFRVLTSGIRLDRFRKNPVMLFEHDRKQVIGKWHDIAIKDNQLVGTPQFDHEDEKALSISKKVEKGFINGASIGLDVLEMDHSGDVPVAVKSEVFETSICAIPSNRNALRIVNEKGELMAEEDVYVKLSLPHKTFSLSAELTGVLGLSGATDKELVEEVRKLKQKPIDELVARSMNEGRFYADDEEYFAKLLAVDFEKGKQLIEKLPEKKRLTDLTKSGTNRSSTFNGYPTEWTLQDYREKAPSYLKKNRAFYLELVEKENQS